MRALGVLLVLLSALALASPAAADGLPQLQGQLTDLTNARVLSSGSATLQSALDSLIRTDDIQLFVLFVETTGGRTATDFADQTATANSLGGNDALLVVALTDRVDAIWRSTAYLDRLTDRELETVLSQQVEPLLRTGDYANAVIAGIDGIRSASRTSLAPATLVPAPAVALPDLGWVVPLLLIAVGIVLLWTMLSSRRRAAAAAAISEKQDAARAHEANTLLIRADESLRDARQEMGYAEAQFSAEDVAPYRDALIAAQTELKAAFTLRQQLDDAVPEDPATRRRMVEEIVARATKALSLLDEQRRRVEALRDLERRAPELLVQLRQQIAATNARVPDAERTRAGFARYAESSWASVKDNVSEARDLLARAAAHVDDGIAAGRTEDAAAAARAVRDGQQDLTEATRLLDAIATLASAIGEAQRSAREHITAAAADIEKATPAAANDAERTRKLASARAALADAEGAVSSPTPDFIAAVKLATEAASGAGVILAAVKQETERRERERSIAAAQLQVARDAYRRASDFIEPRRRTIGSTARTRLAESERHLTAAQERMEAQDLMSVLTEAQSAQRLADDAWSRAQSDVHESESQGPWTGFPRGGPVIIPFPIPIGGGWHGGGGGGFKIPSGIPMPGGGRSVGGRW